MDEAAKRKLLWLELIEIVETENEHLNVWSITTWEDIIKIRPDLEERHSAIDLKRI